MHLSRRTIAGLAAASTAALACAALAAGTADATGAVRSAAITKGAAFTHLAVHSGANNNWGGYVVTGKSYTSVTGDWTVPALNCSATDGDVSFWSGLDGYSSASVEQIGLDAVCASGGAIQYNPWVEMYPANSVYFTETVKAGDKMTSSVTTNGKGSFTLVLADSTRGWSKKYTKTLKTAALSSAEVIVEAIGSQQVSPCPDFGQVKFTGVTANGAGFAADGTLNTTDIERSGTIVTQDGTLSGSSFTVTWKHQ